jgi:hypothetical protein
MAVYGSAFKARLADPRCRVTAPCAFDEVLTNAAVYTARFVITRADEMRHEYDFKVRTADGAWKSM